MWSQNLPKGPIRRMCRDFNKYMYILYMYINNLKYKILPLICYLAVHKIFWLFSNMCKTLKNILYQRLLVQVKYFKLFLGCVANF